MFAEPSESSDELGNALKNVREIPLEQYLSQEKASKVKNARENRLVKKKTMIGGGAGRINRANSDENFTRHAISNGKLTGWSDLDSAVKAKKIEG